MNTYRASGLARKDGQMDADPHDLAPRKDGQMVTDPLDLAPRKDGQMVTNPPYCIAQEDEERDLPVGIAVPNLVPDFVPNFVPRSVSRTYAGHNDGEATENSSEKFAIGNWIGSSAGTSICSHCPMSIHPTPFDQLTTHLAARARTPEGRKVFALLAQDHQAIAESAATDLFELASACHETSGTHPTGATQATSGSHPTGDGIVGALLAASVHYELASLAALVALRPALRRISRRLIANGQDPTEAETDTVTAAYLVTADLAGTSPPYPARALVAATWNRMRTTVRGLQADGLRLTSIPDDLDVEELGADPASFIDCTARVEEILGAAVSAGVVSARQAHLVYWTRVAGECLEKLSEAQGANPATLRKERSRALRALKRHLTGEAASRCEAKGHNFASRGRCENRGHLPVRADQ